MTLGEVRIWGLYTILMEEREGEKGICRKTRDFLREGRGERAYIGKQMSFWKGKWALRRITGVGGGVQLFVTPWIVALQAPLSSTMSQSLLTFMSIESVMPSNHLILCHPLLLLPSL